MSSTKKDITPGQRVVLILKFLCGSGVSPDFLLGIFTIIVAAALCVVSVYSVVFNNRIIGMLSFFVSALFFMVFFGAKSLFYEPVTAMLKDHTVFGLLASLLIIANGLIFVGNAVWFINYMAGLFFYIMFGPVEWFSFWNIPCASGSGTCNIYHDVPWSDFSGEFWSSMMMLFSLQIYAAGGLVALLAFPVYSFFILLGFAVSDKTEDFFGDVNDSQQSSGCSRFFQFVFCSSLPGRYAWMILLSAHVPISFIYSFRYQWPESFYLHALILGSGIVHFSLWSISHYGKSGFDSIKENVSKIVNYTYHQGFVFVGFISYPLILGYLGVLVTLLYFLIDPNADRFFFLETNDLEWPLSISVLLLAIANIGIVMAIVGFIVGFILMIVKKVKNTIKQYKQFEREYVENMEKKTENPIYA
ncbi:hypothetical protein P9112_012648 [Eukaryota sp. TZLM1-RC]